MDNHWAVCDSHPVLCPNGCGSPSLIRQHLRDHLHQDCPMQKINCEFQFAGCLAQVQRKDLAAHLIENLPQHLSQLSNTTKMLATGLEGDIKLRLEGQQQSLKQELDTVSVRERDDFTAAMSEVENMNDSFQRQQDDHQKTIEVTRRSLNRKVSDLEMRLRAVMIAIAVAVILFGIAMYQHNQIVGLQEAVDSPQQKMTSFSLLEDTDDCLQPESPQHNSNTQETVTILQQKVESLQQSIDSSNTQETVTILQQRVESLQRAIDSSNTQETVTILQQKVESLQQSIDSSDTQETVTILQQRVESLQQAIDSSNTQEIVTTLQQKVKSLQWAIENSSSMQEIVTTLQQKVESLQQTVGKLRQTIDNVQQNPPSSYSQAAQGHAWQQLQDQQDKQMAALHELNTTLYHPPLDPSLSPAFGLALNEANTNEATSFVVLPMNVFGAPCFSVKVFHCDNIGSNNVTAKLES